MICAVFTFNQVEVCLTLPKVIRFPQPFHALSFMSLVTHILPVSPISTRKQCCFLQFSTVSVILTSTYFVSLLGVELNFSLQLFNIFGELSLSCSSV